MGRIGPSVTSPGAGVEDQREPRRPLPRAGEPGAGHARPRRGGAAGPARPALRAAAGEDPFPRAEESTAYAQPAIFAACLAAWAERGEAAPAPAWLAGHSLGELTALTVAGALAEADAVELVALRGRLMGEAREGGMLAVMGTGAAEAAPELAAEHGLDVANETRRCRSCSPGRATGCDAAADAASAAGLKPMALPVSGAFHSPLMAPAVAPLPRRARRGGGPGAARSRCSPASPSPRCRTPRRSRDVLWTGSSGPCASVRPCSRCTRTGWRSSPRSAPAASCGAWSSGRYGRAVPAGPPTRAARSSPAGRAGSAPRWPAPWPPRAGPWR